MIKFLLCVILLCISNARASFPFSTVILHEDSFVELKDDDLTRMSGEIIDEFQRFDVPVFLMHNLFEVFYQLQLRNYVLDVSSDLNGLRNLSHYQLKFKKIESDDGEENIRFLGSKKPAKKGESKKDDKKDESKKDDKKDESKKNK